MLCSDHGRDGGNFRFAQILARPHERLERHPAISLTVPRHRVGESQRRPLAIREQRTRLIAQHRMQRIHGQLCLAPQMAATFDAPTAAAALGGELGHEHVESRTEIGSAGVIASECGIRRQYADAAGRGRDRIAGSNERAPEPSHKCTHSVIQLYHRMAPLGKVSSAGVIRSGGSKPAELPF